MGEKRFRIALSFAGEKREFVAQVSDLLAAKFGQDAVLYDAFHEAEFGAARLARKLPTLYHDESDLCVAVFCKEYDQKSWCGLEWDALLDLIAEREEQDVMLCRFDLAKMRGLYGAGFVELDLKTPVAAANLILERLALNEGRVRDFYLRDTDPSAPHRRNRIPNNLPRVEEFFGREDELKKIAEALSQDSRGWGALIDGPGGIGKTSLAIRAAEEVPEGGFKRIVFLSSKERELTADGKRALGTFVLPGYLEMLNAIARELGKGDLAKAPESQRAEDLVRALQNEDVLLILDNLETLPAPDRDQLFAFLNHLPRGSSALVTSRRRADASATTIRLDRLDWGAAEKFIESLATSRPLLAGASMKQRHELYEETGGNPLLIRWIAGQLGLGRCKDIETAVELLRHAPAGNDPLEFIFGDLLDTFSENETRVLAALSHFTGAIETKFIAELADINLEAAEGALYTLSQRALVIPDREERSFALVAMVADFLRRTRSDAVNVTGGRLESRAYALVVENGYEQNDRFPVLEHEWSTVSAALPRLLAGPNDRLQTACGALVRFLEFSGRWDVRLALDEQGEARAVSSGDLWNAGWRAFDQGFLIYQRGEYDGAIAAAERAEEHWQKAKAGARELATSARFRGLCYLQNGDKETGLSLLEEALTGFRSIDPKGQDVAMLLADVGGAHRDMGQSDEAETYYKQAIELADNRFKAIYTGGLAALALDRENWADAERLAREALALTDAFPNQMTMAENMARLAKALARQGNPDQGVPYAKQAVEIYTHLGHRYLPWATGVLEECEKGAGGF